MSTESNITDRTLERLKLGELSDDEAAAVMARLEETGESYRLDELIEADEEFLEGHPAPVAASQIRELARRRSRAGESPRNDAPGWRLLILPAAAALALAVVMAGLYIFENAEQTESVEPRVADSTDPVTDTEPMPPEELPSAPSMPIEPEPEWSGLLDWVVKNDEGSLVGIACTPGETMSFDANSVARVSIDQNALVTARESDDGDSLMLECQKPGLANVNLIRDDRSSVNLVARIAEPYEESGATSVGPRARLAVELGRCPDLRDMAMKIVVERGNYAPMVIVGGGTPEQRTCLRDAARKVFSGELPPSKKWGYSVLSMTW